MRIIFMGTPEFAVPSLDILVRAGYPIVAVITATDKYGGRGGKQLIESAVKKYALGKGIKVLQPRNLKDPDFVQEVGELQPDLQVVVAFRMLPRVIWDLPTIGTINLHGSLLPRYRGAAPINWAIIRGEKETGVTTFFIQQKIDTGDVLLQRSLAIGPDETAGELHDRMMKLGAQVVLETVRLVESGRYAPKPQDHRLASPAPKIFHDDCRIDFSRKAPEVHDFIRGMSPYPGGWTLLHGKILKILKSSWVETAHDYLPGSLIPEPKDRLRFAAEGGYVDALEVKMEGKRKMPAQEFRNGYSISGT